MHRNSTILLTLALLSFAASFAAAQSQQNAPVSSVISKSTTAIGFPVAGWQKNRRVEIVLSGEVIGVKIGK
jgi:hypothetical protein